MRADQATCTPRPVLNRGEKNRTSAGKAWLPTNYERFNSNNVRVGHLSWNYRGCWHQTGPQVDARCIPWVLTHSTSPSRKTGDW